jgi:hypothetical protein
MNLTITYLKDDEEPEKIIQPLYVTEFVLEIESLTFRPDLEFFREGITEIMQRFKETLLQVNNLVPDTYFDSFTRFTFKMLTKLSFFNIFTI